MLNRDLEEDYVDNECPLCVETLDKLQEAAEKLESVTQIITILAEEIEIGGQYITHAARRSIRTLCRILEIE